MSHKCAGTSKQTGKPCKNDIADHKKVCRFHGGAAGQVAAAAERRLAEAEVRQELTQLGVPVAVDAGDALMAMVYEANGNVAVLRTLVQDLPMHPVIIDQDDIDEFLEAQPQGGALKRNVLRPGTVLPALYGPDHNGDGRPHVLVAMYDAERDRLANLSALALKAGIDERRTRLAEAEVERLAGAVNKALAAIPAEHREAFRLELAKNLRSA